MSDAENEAVYFIREDGRTFRPTAHVSGGWNPEEQHIAPVIGLLAHAAEQDFRRRRPGDDLRLLRLSADILGVIPLESFTLDVEVLRPGRTIELVEVRLSHGGRAAVSARIWFSAAYDTAGLAGSALPAFPGREGMERWGMSTDWPGGFVRSVEIRRSEVRPGEACFWLRSDVRLLDGEPVSRVAHALRLIDVANGVAARVPPEEALFPNLDITVHLFREPQGDWTGLDSRASIGPSGAGLTNSVLHDDEGPFGVFAQTLTVRPRGKVTPGRS